MRILCLHDENSSGQKLLDILYPFAQKLYSKHNIELAFVNAPLITMNDIDNNNNNNEDDDDQKPRTWFYPKNNHHSNNNDKITGLDASILNLQQIWKQSLNTTHPFNGILGVGQGAALAALLPLLQMEQTIIMSNNHQSCNGEEEENEEEEEDGMVSMFQGIQFCIFYNGFDLLSETNYNQEKENRSLSSSSAAASSVSSCCCYQEVKDMPSLHIVSTSSSIKQKSLDLYQHYGGDVSMSSAQLSLIDNQNSSLSASASLDKNTTMIYNCIGKFLIQQKKKINAIQKHQLRIRKQIHMINNSIKDTSLGGSSTTIDENNQEVIEAMMEETKMKLAIVEEQAQSIMASTIAMNPPKALMAIITPDVNNRDGTILGGWAGQKDAFRSEDFKESGGAPCPKTFVLKQHDRQDNEDEVNS